MENTLTAPKQEKHASLDDAINSFRHVESRLQSLLSRINGSNDDTGGVPCERTAPTLSSVLANGPDQLGNQNQRLLDLITEIEEQLF